jgi:hypothetical protein
MAHFCRLCASENLGLSMTGAPFPWLGRSRLAPSERPSGWLGPSTCRSRHLLMHIYARHETVIHALDVRYSAMTEHREPRGSSESAYVGVSVTLRSPRTYLTRIITS